MAEKLLIVDDDQSICEILEFNLKSEGYLIETAHSAEEGISKLTDTIDLILLDVMMGGMSGYKMAEKLRNQGKFIPIIFLTAKDTENDMLTGFSVGGDDFISKPFSIKEVVARVKAVLNRTKQTAPNEEKKQTLVVGPITINQEKKEVFIREQPINLTKTEFGIIVLLATQPERVFSREEIIDNVWGEGTFVTDRTVDVHITRLRKKMGTVGEGIVNRFGFGYRFDMEKI